MANKITGHLDEDLIIEAIIDESGLDPASRMHLRECSACRAERELLEGRLTQFGELSRECSPVPLRRPRLSGEKPAVARPAWKFRPSFGMGLVFASLIALLLNPYIHKHDLFNHKKDASLEQIYQEMLRDAEFMAEIEKLEENPLPVFYVDMTNFTEPDTPDELQDSKLLWRDDLIT